ncbi:MAG: TonB family protein [Cyclobacteriaceae bacterium]|nr:TonB family protein [Cyclobacteriaceae bacterium]
MEAKKYPQADLSAKRNLFLAIGLISSISLALMAFEWKQFDTAVVTLSSQTSMIDDTFIEVPPTEILPPAPVVLQQPKLIEVPNQQEIEQEIQFVFDIEVTEGMKLAEVPIIEFKPIETPEETDQVFTVVEDKATPKNGLEEFYKYVNTRITYPAAARRMGVEGKVFVEFIVSKTGELTDVHAVKGIGAGCDEEAERIIKDSPPWNPAKQRGKPVRQRMVLPITFKLG